jgi:hypothetical protein
MSQNHSTSKPGRRPKNKRRKDYTRTTALAMRSEEAIGRANQQNLEIFSGWLKTQARAVARRRARDEAHAARHGAKQ